MNSSIASRFNANLLDEKFALWRDDPRSVDSDWAAFFEGFSLGMAQIEKDICIKLIQLIRVNNL